MKGNRSLDKLFDAKANTETNIFEKMNHQPEHTNEGKKFFKAKVVNTANLMHLSDNPKWEISTAE